MCKIKVLQRLVVVGQIWDVFLKVGKRHITQIPSPAKLQVPVPRLGDVIPFQRKKTSEILCDFLSNKNIFSIASVFDIAELL